MPAPDETPPPKSIGTEKKVGAESCGGQPASPPDPNMSTEDKDAIPETPERSQTKERRERIRTAQTVISIVSLLVGLPVAVNGFRETITNAFRKPLPSVMTPTPVIPQPVPVQSTAVPTEKEKLEIQKLREELRQGEPRFDVRYLVVRSGTFGKWESGEAPSLGSFIPAVTYRNLVFDRVIALSGSQRGGEPDPGWSTAQVDWNVEIDEAAKLRGALDSGGANARGHDIVCLQLKQEGKRKAEDLKLTVRKAELKKAVELSDIDLLTNDGWLKRLGEGATTEESFEFNALGQGDSIIVPLAIVEELALSGDNEEARISQKRWHLVRDKIYLPVKLEFRDRLLDTRHAIPIRKIFKRPEVLAPGLETRG